VSARSARMPPPPVASPKPKWPAVDQETVGYSNYPINHPTKESKK
jgi:hypothetical protein